MINKSILISDKVIIYKRTMRSVSILKVYYGYRLLIPTIIPNRRDATKPQPPLEEPTITSVQSLTLHPCTEALTPSEFALWAKFGK